MLSTGLVRLNIWTHVFATYYYNGSAVVNIYLNGILDKEDVNVEDEFQGGQHWIGWENRFYNSFNGTIDDVRVYNRSLNSLEVYDLFNRTNQKYFDTKLSDDWQIIAYDQKYKDSSIDDIFMWADYSCNFANWRLWEPTFYFRGCAANVTICSEDII